MTNFNECIDFRAPLKTTFQGKELILYHCYLYQGPITLQALPYGGIQSFYQYHLIIYTKSAINRDRDFKKTIKKQSLIRI